MSKVCQKTPLYTTGIAEKSLNRLLLLLISKAATDGVL